MARTLLGFEAMWDAYPNPGGSAAEAKRTIGGKVDVEWITNTCVVRVSRSFNASGNPIPGADDDGLATVKGADFYPAGVGGSGSVRLAFSFASPSEIAEGVSTLAGLLRA